MAMMRTSTSGCSRNGRRFAFAAGIGVDAYMIERTPRRWKRRLGVVAYALTWGRGVMARDRFDVRATVDGRRSTSGAPSP